MISQNQVHLNEDMIVGAVIDDNELTGKQRQHLLECRFCHGKVEQFKSELQEFGENTRLSAPPLTKNIILPSDEPDPASYKSSWLPSFGAAVMAGLVLFFYFLGMESRSLRFTPLQSPGISLEDENLMEEIFEMVENPLSDELYQITGDNGGFDEEFFQFIIPDIQEDFQSQYYIQGGIKQC
jgi:hypothetical protein